MRIGLAVLSLLSLSVPAFAADVPESYYERQSEYREEAPPPVEREVVVEERRPVYVEEEPVVEEEIIRRPRPRVVIEEDWGHRRHHGYWRAGYGRW